MEYLCPFMNGKPCAKVKCALYYEDNDTCALYQIAINSDNLADNFVSVVPRILGALEGKMGKENDPT